MNSRLLFPSTIVGIALLTGCGGGGSSSSSSVAGNAVPVASIARSTADATATDLSGDAATTTVIHVGFKHKAITSPKYGPVAFYSKLATGQTQIVFAKAGSKVQFLNDDTTRHTASGLGSTSFPASFDNTSGLTPTGTAIDSSLTWNTGSLNPNAKSQVFTLGPKGTYYFGCYYHYRVSPSMRDVIVSQ